MTRTSMSDGAVRVTLHPGEDVLLRPGARLGDVRAPLAALTRRPELRYTPLTVDGACLADNQVVGERPLLPGAVLQVASTDSPGRTTAARSWPASGGAWTASGGAWLVARVTGPDAGAMVGVDGPWAAARAWVRLRPGGRLAVRRAGGPATWLAPRPEPGLGPGGVPWALALLPAIASLGLAAALRQPLLAVFALLGLVVAVPQLRAARQRAAAHGAVRDRSREVPGPARLLGFAHAALQVSPGAWAAAREAHATAQAVSRAPVPSPVPSAIGVLVGAPVGAPVGAQGRAQDGDAWDQLLHDGAVAVLGPDDLARSVARALVAGLAARGATVRVGAAAPGWCWARWLPDGGPLVLVTDRAPGNDHTRAATASALAGPALDAPAAGFVVSVGAVPPGCRAVVRVLDAHRVRITGPDGAERVTPLVGVTADWAERLARLLAGAAWLGRTSAALHGSAVEPAEQALRPGLLPGLLPDVVPLTRAHDLSTAPGPEAVAARWADARTWAVPLGIGVDGAPVCLDLVRDGPHLLVAGTTGSGKSELLQTLVLGLALTRSPDDLALVLVDFKGGASLGVCPGLPHVVGQVTDLEPGLAARALAGLRAELRRRERILAARSVPDVAALPTGTLPRLVVVIDEFRALADDLPQFLPALLRVAAQGRSLGVHLVLATQRPGGAVGPDLQANVSARVALRVTDALESRDVLDDPAAAHISTATPGRALLRLGSAPPVLLQCARATAPPMAEPPLVRRAPAWLGRTWPDPARPDPARPDRAGTVPVSASAALRGHVPGGPAVPALPDVATLVAEAAREAARALGHVPGAPPWQPPLPRQATGADLPPATRRSRAGLVLALGDDPDLQRRTAVVWDPRDGHLAILGRARSGRTTALITLALAALRQGWAVHGIARDARPLAALRHHPGYGRTIHPDDAAAIAHLLSDAAPAGDRKPVPDGSPDASQERSARTLVLVDGAEDVRGTLPPAALRPGVAFALSADGPSLGGLAARVGPRLVLLSTDRSADVVLGAPVALAGSGGPPGRAAWCGRGDPVLCQVLVPDGPPGRSGISPRSRSPTSRRRPRES
ncbi:FtsK/SpoIIIE domain-containing protein [Promicromonospora sp. Populi]|uniref:FtsK/SpoIIIE domain-containing protein n=1 Tax=Promicromonospora sp. Populi TaxID=3239420 RepID=UPI0034E29929